MKKRDEDVDVWGELGKGMGFIPPSRGLSSSSPKTPKSFSQLGRGVKGQREGCF